jgi:hypothetical protein
MKIPKLIPHANCVDNETIEARFSDDGLHRYSLKLPFRDRETGKVLLIIGQNPSEANQSVADKTINYLERYVFQNLPQYDGIIMLNLYTRMDKHKVKNDVMDCASDRELRMHLSMNSDVLLVFGRLKNERAYKFKNRVLQLRDALESKKLYKLAINTNYAPHPGNPNILYSKIGIGIDEYRFGDL